MPYPVRSIAERLERSKNVNGQCWEWTGCYTRDGYGVMTIDKKSMRVSRVAFEHYKGTPPGEMLVCHTCDNTKCFNPAHLFLGTPIDNMQDMIAKGRRYDDRGERSARALLTEKKVLEIRHQRNVLKKKLNDIAAEFGITFQTVSDIARGKSWKHVGGGDA